MPIITLRSHRTQQPLYSGNFQNTRECLEHAVRDGALLTGADLRNLDLSNAALDDLILEDADFTNTNLTGANMSEAVLQNCNFSGAALYNACICFSQFEDCMFESTSFGATDVLETSFIRCVFSTLSCFSLDFIICRTMEGCVFMDRGGKTYPLTRPPLVLKGLQQGSLIMMDEHVRFGGIIRPLVFPIKGATTAAVQNALSSTLKVKI